MLREDLDVERAHDRRAASELQTEKAIHHAVQPRPCVEVEVGVKPQRKADGSHFQRVPRSGGRTGQNAEMLRPGCNKECGVLAGAPLACLHFIEDEQRVLRHIPQVALTLLAALGELPHADALVVRDEQRLDAEATRHLFPVWEGGFRGNDYDRVSEPCGHGSGNIGLACTGGAGIQSYPVIQEGAFDALGMFLLVRK